jgi:hypothetical protein
VTGWERLAVFEGGTVTSLAVATAADGARHVFAATLVGVFRSADGGLSWGPLDEASALPGIEVVAPSPRYAQDGTLFAGARDGLYRWHQGQPGWTHLLSGSRVLALTVLPGADSNRNDVASLTLLVGTEDDGILISRDGGRTWEGANPGLLDLTILALAVSPDFDQDGLAFAATPSGLYRTRNGGESWRAVDLEWDDLTIQCLAVSPAFAEDRVLLAGTEDHGLLRSDDAGRSWEQAPGLVDQTVNSLVYGIGGRVVAGTDRGVALSDDAGQSWRIVGEDLGSVLSVALEGPGGGSLCILAGLPDHGIARSVDDGRTWAASNNGLAAGLIVGLALGAGHEHDRTVLTASLQSGVSVSTDGGRTWAARNNGLEGATVYQVATWESPAGEQLAFAATDGGLYLSRDDGASWALSSPGEPSAPIHAVTLASSPGSLEAVVASLADGRLAISTDRGSTWEALATRFGQAEVVALALSPALADTQDGTIFVVTAGPSEQLGSGSLVVWRTTDRGRRWDRWYEEWLLPDGGPVRLVALPPNRWDDTVVLGIGGRVLRPRQGSWEVKGGARRPVWDAVGLVGEEPPGRPPAIAGLDASPAYPRDRTIFAATSAGVYVSRDGGAGFAAWSHGLEPRGTVAVASSPAYSRDRLVYALGLGGTIWRRRDASTGAPNIGHS